MFLVCNNAIRNTGIMIQVLMQHQDLKQHQQFISGLQVQAYKNSHSVTLPDSDEGPTTLRMRLNNWNLIMMT